MPRTPLFLMVAIMVSVSACDLTSSIENPDISVDKDFDTLVSMITGRLAAIESSQMNISSDWEGVYHALIENPLIQSLAAELRTRYPDLNTEGAVDALRDYLASKGIDFANLSATMSKVSNAQYYACLASVASMGVIMMAGCSAAGPVAVVCGAAVVTWVGSQSTLCYLNQEPT